MTNDRKRKIRLIALDVDGTLLDDQKQLPAANREALRAARARGVEIAIASGRMIPTIEPIETLLGLDCSIIAYNGGKVVSCRATGRRCLAHNPLSAGIAERLIRFSLEHGYLLNFYHEDVLYADRSVRRGEEFRAIYSGRTGAKYHLTDLDGLRGTSPTKLILLSSPPDCDRLQREFSAEFRSDVNVTRSDPEYLEFMAPGVDKGSALPVLAGDQGIAVEEILAMGDADNDLELVSRAGLGVAVGNARPRVKAAARRVTQRSNNDGAVAEAVERWVLNGEEWW